jgi:hypothetical protein
VALEQGDERLRKADRPLACLRLRVAGVRPDLCPLGAVACLAAAGAAQLRASVRSGRVTQLSVAIVIAFARAHLADGARPSHAHQSKIFAIELSSSERGRQRLMDRC